MLRARTLRNIPFGAATGAVSTGGVTATVLPELVADAVGVAFCVGAPEHPLTNDEEEATSTMGSAGPSIQAFDEAARDLRWIMRAS